MEKKSPFWWLLGFSVAFVALLILAASVSPEKGPFGNCLIHKYFGLYCLSCGGSRALYALLHGHPIQSLRYLPTLWVMLALVIYLLARGWVAFFQKKERLYYGKRWMYVTLIVIWVGYGLFRDVLLIFFQIDMPGDFLPPH